jgi:putative oxidoreductase
MEELGSARSRSVSVLLWVLTIVIALGIGLAGATKFLQPDRWEPLFAGWGYPAWASKLTGVVEMVGAVALLIPKTTFFAALLLGAVMLGALLTLLTHSGGPLGWGATPLVYLVLLLILAAARRRDQAARV